MILSQVTRARCTCLAGTRYSIVCSQQAIGSHGDHAVTFIHKSCLVYHDDDIRRWWEAGKPKPALPENVSTGVLDLESNL